MSYETSDVTGLEFQKWLSYESPPLNLNLTYTLVIPWISQGEFVISTANNQLALDYANRSDVEHFVQYQLLFDNKAASAVNAISAGEAGNVWSSTSIRSGQNMLGIFGLVDGFDSREGKMRIINRSTGEVSGVEFYIYPTANNTFKFMYRRV